MKFNFLKFKKNSPPSLQSLRPRPLDVDLFWFIGLGLFLVIVVITTIISLRLFYSQYSEDYKKSASDENFKDLINISRLESTINKRNNFINKEISLPKDPSL